MVKHLEIKTYEYFDIRVTVEINYDKKEISLVKRTLEMGMPAYYKESYVFAGRGLEYMNGWRNVLAGINYAIDQAEKELTEYLKMKEKENHDLVTDVLMKATDLVNQKKYGKKKSKN